LGLLFLGKIVGIPEVEAIQNWRISYSIQRG